MAVYFIVNIIALDEIQPDIVKNSVYYGTNYMITENVVEYDNHCNVNVTTVENQLSIANSFTPITIINIDYDLESDLSDCVYSTADGLVSLSALDYQLNFEDLISSEALQLMDTIAYGDFLDDEEEHADDEHFNRLVDEAYDHMDVCESTEEFHNLKVPPSNQHVSAWQFCTQCGNYGHLSNEHC